MPTSVTKTQENRPALTFIGDNEQAEIFVNNVKMGKVGNFLKQNGKALFIEEGIANIKIAINGSVIWSEKTFISGNEVREINLK